MIFTGVTTKCLDVRRRQVGFPLKEGIFCTQACPGHSLVHLVLLSNM